MASSNNTITPHNKFWFDNEVGYRDKHIDVKQYASSTSFAKNLPIDTVCREHIECILEGKLRYFNKYSSIYAQDILQKISALIILELDLTGGIVRVVSEERKLERRSFLKEAANTFALKSRFSIEVITVYLNEVRYPGVTSFVSTHAVLYFLIKYLLSINVISVNTERSFNKPNKIYGDIRRPLDEDRAGNELLFGTVTSILDLDIPAYEEEFSLFGKWLD